MEFYLGTDTDKIRFPIPPPEIGVNRSAIIDVEKISNGNEVAIFNGSSLKVIEFESFFPNGECYFTQYQGYMKPSDFSYKLQRWLEDGTPLRFIVTDIDINMPCLIEGYNDFRKDGTNNLHFSITLKEFRKITIPKSGAGYGY